MELTTKQLRSLIGRHKTDVKLNINPLSMKLNGIIDAAVMGGISNYEKVSRKRQFYIRNVSWILYDIIQVIVDTTKEYCINVPCNKAIFSSWRDIGMACAFQMSGVNNRKFVINFRSSQVRQAHSCIRYQWKTFNMSSDISVFGTFPRQNNNARAE